MPLVEEGECFREWKFWALIFFVERIEQEHGKWLATIESKQDVLEGRFAKVLRGQREVVEKLDSKPR